jgi:hypothetical protein
MFESYDGSRWKVIPASRLATLTIWNGNRTLDMNHVQRIRESIKDIRQLNLNPFKVVVFNDDYGEQYQIVDGQHRATLIKQYFSTSKAEDFEVVIIEKHCMNESEIIQHFKVLNTTKAIQWREDPVLVANRYIDALCQEFNIGKQVIKPGKTTRPYVSTDKLREELISRHVVDWKISPSEFVERCKHENEVALQKMSQDVNMEKRAIQHGFALGLLPFSVWMSP